MSTPELSQVEREAKAVEDAIANADNSFTPTPSLLNAADPNALLQQVDGPDLSNYEVKESVYVGMSVPVALRAVSEVPIHVTAPGSIVEYTIETKHYDICFGVLAEREEGVTIVKEKARVNSHVSPVTGKFLVGTVPCLLKFEFDNSFSMFREKLLSYKISVTPPSLETLMGGRRRRAKAASKVVVDDLGSAKERLASASFQKVALDTEIAKLEALLEEKKKALETAVKEEDWLLKRVQLRTDQQDLLEKRLAGGWADEIAKEK